MDLFGKFIRLFCRQQGASLAFARPGFPFLILVGHKGRSRYAGLMRLEPILTAGDIEDFVENRLTLSSEELEACTQGPITTCRLEEPVVVIVEKFSDGYHLTFFDEVPPSTEEVPTVSGKV